MVISNNHFGSKWFYDITTLSWFGFIKYQCVQVLVICDKSRENVVFTNKYSNHGKFVAFLE